MLILTGEECNVIIDVDYIYDLDYSIIHLLQISSIRSLSTGECVHLSQPWLGRIVWRSLGTMV